MLVRVSYLIPVVMMMMMMMMIIIIFVFLYSFAKQNSMIGLLVREPVEKKKIIIITTDMRLLTLTSIHHTPLIFIKTKHIQKKYHDLS